MSGSGKGPSVNRRTILGAIAGGTAVTAVLGGEELREAAEVAIHGEVHQDDIDDLVSEDELDDQAKEAGREGGQEAVDEATAKEVYKGINSGDFQDVYETLKDDYSASDYGVTVGSSQGIHDEILEEDFYDRWTDDDSETSIEGFDIQWGKKDAVDSKRRYEVDMDGEERYISDEIQDGAAKAFVEAAKDEIEDFEDEYGADKW